jgi:hypothetical protein
VRALGTFANHYDLAAPGLVIDAVAQDIVE